MNRNGFDFSNYDFSGWATKNDIRCSDGLVIRKDAFKAQDGRIVPIVWNHSHNDPDNVLGHGLLENRDEGVYVYGVFNETPRGQHAKELVRHGDVQSLSIWANKLSKSGSDVMHGTIREVSLVLAGANPGAYIDEIIEHSDNGEVTAEAIISTGEDIVFMNNNDIKSSLAHADEKKEEKTVKDVFDSMTDEQKEVVYLMVGAALKQSGAEADDEDGVEQSDEGGEFVKHNVFEQNDVRDNGDILSHSDMTTLVHTAIADAKRYGSMKDSFLAHAQEYGIENLDYLFPDYRKLTNEPILISRDMEWVSTVMNGVHHSPFSRVKSIFANITEDDARAKGYIKGKYKTEEVFSLLKRTTDPTTVYKKQKMDRDDVIDITDIDVIAYIKKEMRVMLNEELARAILFGDGRSSASDDKISEINIRPVWTDNDLFTVKHRVVLEKAATENDKANAFIEACIRSRKNYKGSGNPVLFTTEDMLDSCLLLKDLNGRFIYESVDQLKRTLRVSDIKTVELMDNLTRKGTGDDSSKTLTLMGIYLNMNDYNVGADRGGAITLFDDFDIDYNQQKYLLETRCSGALTRPFSAVAIESETKSA